MRHFLNKELGLPLAVAGLSSRVQPPPTGLSLVRSSRTLDGIAALLDSTCLAEALSAITSPADPELNTTTSAGKEPVRFRRQEAPSRADFWTWSSNCVEGRVLRRQSELQKARSCNLRAFAIFGEGRCSTPSASPWPRSSPVNGERARASSRAFHRLYADRATRPQQLAMSVSRRLCRPVTCTPFRARRGARERYLLRCWREKFSAEPRDARSISELGPGSTLTERGWRSAAFERPQALR